MRGIWYCKVGEADRAKLPHGSDFPMRQAVKEAFFKLTGEYPDFVSSGWGPLVPDEHELEFYKEHNF